MSKAARRAGLLMSKHMSLCSLARWSCSVGGGVCTASRPSRASASAWWRCSRTTETRTCGGGTSVLRTTIRTLTSLGRPINRSYETFPFLQNIFAEFAVASCWCCGGLQAISNVPSGTYSHCLHARGGSGQYLSCSRRSVLLVAYWHEFLVSALSYARMCSAFAYLENGIWGALPHHSAAQAACII